MRILILGLGVIGAVYGYAFQRAGHEVEHWVRPQKRAACPKRLTVRLLDGRREARGAEVTDAYEVRLAERGGAYDLVLVSVAGGRLEEAVQTLDEAGLRGPLLLFLGYWADRAALREAVAGRQALTGFPVAGGALSGDTLSCVLFDHVLIERRGEGNAGTYDLCAGLLRGAGLKLESPHDMLEWIWPHMAINAAVITAAGRYGGVEDPSRAASLAMESPRILARIVRAVRETASIVAARGVSLRRYRGELWPYRLPAWLAGLAMCRMFRASELTRRIMTLHGNSADLLYVCRSVYESGRAAGVDAPVFYANYAAVEAALAESARQK